MTGVVRPLDVHFDALEDWPYVPHDYWWQGLRVRYVDEGPVDGPVMLLLHGMPTWAFLYRDMIPLLCKAGYRCVAPDHLGFGRSDKPTDPGWYSIARHREVLASLINGLDLDNVTLVCQDWGGPIGLAQAVTMPHRFSRLVVMNTWLHHAAYEYGAGMRGWVDMWLADGLFDRERPDVACVPMFSGELAPMDQLIAAIARDERPVLAGAAAANYAGWAAPFRDLPDEAFNGARAFPLSVPLGGAGTAEAAAQAAHYEALLEWPKPAHFVWGGADPVFTERSGGTWADRMGASFDVIPDANHFLQNTHAAEVVEHVLRRISDEKGPR